MIALQTTLTRRISTLAALLLPLAGLIAASVLIIWGAQVSKGAEQEVRLGLRVLSQIHSLHAQLAEGASGIRGYLLTQNESFLAPYELAAVRLPPALETLSGKVKDPEQQVHLRLITTLITDKLANLALIKAQASTQHIDQTLKTILNDNKNLLDRLRKTIVLMEQREEAVIAERSAIADRWRQQALMLSLIAVVLVLLSMALAVWLAWRTRHADAAAVAAEQTNRAKSDMLSRVSHELRTPLNGILGYAQLLSRQRLPDSAQRHVGHILASGDHLLQLVNDVLDLSRHELRAVSLDCRELALMPLLNDAMAWVQSNPGAEHMHWQISVSADDVVLADEQRLRQIMINLLSNAVKFNRPSGTVSIAVTTQGSTHIIAVSDSGFGLSEADQARLFQPFERLHDSSIEGTGLGLCISHQLAQAMAGALSASSVLGEGSTFTLRLPRFIKELS
ncbi:MAG: ATP-binding protein [Paraperlucidibaca sp.]